MLERRRSMMCIIKRGKSEKKEELKRKRLKRNYINERRERRKNGK